LVPEKLEKQKKWTAKKKLKKIIKIYKYRPPPPPSPQESNAKNESLYIKQNKKRRQRKLSQKGKNGGSRLLASSISYLSPKITIARLNCCQ